MSNVKPGDLARVVSNGERISLPELIDRIVVVVRPAVEGELVVSTCGARAAIFLEHSIAWIVTSPTPLHGRCSDGKVRLFKERAISDRYLRPIGGVPVTDDVDIEVPA